MVKVNCVGCEIMVSVDDEKEGRSTVAAIGRQAGRQVVVAHREV